MKGLIYVADDEKNIRDLIKTFLLEAGHEVLVFENGDDLYRQFEIRIPDLIILDVMMPGVDGFTLTNRIRKISDVSILLLTARDTDADYVTGFTSGCDDYFTKPFSPVKLTMRVNAILKRQLSSQTNIEDKDLVFEDIEIDSGLRVFKISGDEVKLTNTEFDMMEYFLKNKSRAVSRNELLENIWGYENAVETRVTDDTIKRIRKKLRDNNSKTLIETVWGFGFKLTRRTDDE